MQKLLIDSRAENDDEENSDIEFYEDDFVVLCSFSTYDHEFVRTLVATDCCEHPSSTLSKKRKAA